MMWCLLLGLWRSLRLLAPVSGHDLTGPEHRVRWRPGIGLVEEQVLTCRRCGGESVGWVYWYGPEPER